MTSPLVARVVAQAEARAAYEQAWEARNVSPSPHTELLLELARERWTLTLAILETGV